MKSEENPMPEDQDYWLSVFAPRALSALGSPDFQLEDSNVLWEGGSDVLKPFETIEFGAVPAFISSFLYENVCDEFQTWDPGDYITGKPMPIDSVIKAFGIECETFSEWLTDQEKEADSMTYDEFWYYLLEGMTQVALVDEIADRLQDAVLSDVHRLQNFYEWAAPYVKNLNRDLSESEREEYFDPFGRLKPVPIPEWAISKVLKRDGSLCGKCHESVSDSKAAIGYLVHPRDWGLNEIGNLAVLCDKCQRRG
jgi:hypothetical protein